MSGRVKVPSCDSGRRTTPTGVFTPTVPSAWYPALPLERSVATACPRSANWNVAGNVTSALPCAGISRPSGGLPVATGCPSMLSR